MTVSDLLSPSRDRPDRAQSLAAILLLALSDAALIVLLPHAMWVVAAIAAVTFCLALASRLHWTLALIAAGAPLIDPISVALRTEAPVYFALRASLVLGIGWHFLGAAREPGQTAARVLADPIFLWAVALGGVVSAGLFETPSPDYGRMKVVAYASTCLPLLAGGFLLAMRRFEDDEEAADRRFDLFCRAVVIAAALIALAAL